MMDTRTDALAGLAKIRQRFLDTLVEHEWALSNLLLAFDDAELAVPALDKAQFILHRIAGTAGSLGFAPLGDHARRCEEMIMAHRESGEPAVDPIADEIDDFTAECRAILGA